MNKIDTKRKIKTSKESYFRVSAPSRAFHRVGALLAGFWMITTLLRFIWPEADQISTESSLSKQLEKIHPPKESISILLLEVKEKNDKLLKINSNSRNTYKFNQVTMIILKEKSTEIIDISPELAIQMPGEFQTKTLNFALSIGGIALANDLITNILIIPPSTRQRYILGKELEIEKFREVMKLKSNETLNISSRNNSYQAKIISKEIYRSSSGIQSSKYILSRYEIPKSTTEEYNNLAQGRDNFLSNINVRKITKDFMNKTNTNLSYKEFLSVNAFLLREISHRKFKRLRSI